MNANNVCVCVCMCVCVLYQLKIKNKSSQCIEWPMIYVQTAPSIATRTQHEQVMEPGGILYTRSWIMVDIIKSLSCIQLTKSTPKLIVFCIYLNDLSMMDTVKSFPWIQLKKMMLNQHKSLWCLVYLDNGEYSEITWILCIQLTKST